MRISIIIPTYNCDQYLKKAIDSVLQQPYENKELIVIDGLSKDNTVEILKSYGSQIKWVSEKDTGQANAINKGFKMASGDIVTWLGADDYYEPDIFNDVIAGFKKSTDIVMVYGKCKSIYKDKFLLNIPPKIVTAKNLINKGNTVYQPSSFYKLQTVKDANYIDESLTYWMEYDLFIKILQNGSSCFLDKILANFTIREDQKSNIKNISEMNRELLYINKKYGGNVFSKVYIHVLFSKIKSFIKRKI